MIKVHRNGARSSTIQVSLQTGEKEPQSFKISFKYCWDKQASAEGRKQLKVVRPVL